MAEETLVEELPELVTRDALELARDEMMALGDFAAAKPRAEELVEALRADDETQTRDLALALTKLCHVHRELKETDSAEGCFLESIELIESEEKFDPALVDPYRGLGRTLIDADRGAEAVAVLDQARHISRRNFGLFNAESQAEILDDQTDAYLSINDTVTARKLQRERVNIALRAYGVDDERTVPFRNQLAEYYKRSQMKASARRQYQRIIEVHEKQDGDNSPKTLQPLRQIVRLNLTLDDQGFARNQIVDVLEANPVLPAMEQAQSLATLGDWSMVYQSSSDKAFNYYRQAHEVLAATGQDSNSFFATPVVLDFIPPLTRVDERGPTKVPIAWGEITLEFGISERGRAYDVEVVTAEPADLMEGKFRRRILETHFRPRLVDGVAVAVDKARVTYPFRYYIGQEK